MKSSHFIALFASAVNSFLYCSLCRTPADDTDSSILITIPLWFGQLLGRGIKLTVTFFHHCRMIFWFIFGMAALIMFQSSGYISRSPGTRRAGWGDATCG